MKVRLYENIKNVERYNESEIDLVLRDIKMGRWSDAIIDYHNGKIAKDQLPNFTVSGEFNGRKDSGLVAHSGFICMDVDGIDNPDEVREWIRGDQYVYAAFKSCSGKGLAIVFRINGKDHRDMFYSISDYLLKEYDIVCDPSGVNESRTRFISYDPEIYINEDAIKFTKKLPRHPKRKIEKVVFVQSDFEQILVEIQQKNIDLVDAYRDWLAVGFGLADKFGESGRDYFHAISSIGGKYKPRVCDKQYDNCLKGKRFGTTIATFYWLCKNAGISIVSEQTKTIINSAVMGKRGGLSKSAIIDNLLKFEDVSPDESGPIIDQVQDKGVDVITEDAGVIDQIELFLEQNYQFERNAITRIINVKERYPSKQSESGWQELNTQKMNTIFIKMKRAVPKATFELCERSINCDRTPTVNPILEFFEAHKGINPKGAIDNLLDSIVTDTGVDDDFCKRFGKKWLVGVVASAMGMHSPLMFVLSGSKQKTGKTEWFRRLLPDELKPYYAESNLDGNQNDADILMCKKLIIMDDEMGGKNKTQYKKLKQKLSAQTFSLREPYGKYHVDMRRLAVLCGTTNEDELLSDPTGNRRLIPVNVLSIKRDQFNTQSKVDVFVEAYKIWEANNEYHHLTDEDVEILNRNTGNFEQPSFEREMFMKYFRRGEVEFMTTSEIKSYIDTRSGERVNLYKLGVELKALGFNKIPMRREGQAIRGYWVERKAEGAYNYNHERR